ncbi:hypothetical protein Q8G35_12590 [Peribacillus simplex]|uniref:Uncharacterized protein n=2 Tax=Peribacillus TaxID=2675229 RepID=A0AA90T317_9BACI|nr:MULTISPECIES: hypothetical protein [Peribacillus]MDP1419249.1 hypothetical protein [Peribacillus simplex]MDP1452113.1 hypothetical protein [Peribacillus frigoritolerans]
MTIATRPTINKPLRSINIAPKYSNLNNLPVVENKEKRQQILKNSLESASKIKVF